MSAINTQPGPKLWGVQSDASMRIQLERLRGQLSIERSTFLPHWQDIDLYLAPRRARFYISDVDRGYRKNQFIINSKGTHAWMTLRSGMMSGFTSPSRPWFRLTTQDPDLAKFESVKEWLYDVTWRMHDMFLRSNVYNILPTVYGDMSGFGTGCMMVMEDFDKGIHCYEFPLGSYYIFNNDKLRVNGFMRDFRLSVRQIVEKFVYDSASGKFDWERCSSMVKNLWDAGTTEAWVDLVQYIGPNAAISLDRCGPRIRNTSACTMSGARRLARTRRAFPILRRRLACADTIGSEFWLPGGKFPAKTFTERCVRAWKRWGI